VALSSFNEVPRPLQDVAHIKRYKDATTLTNASIDSSDHALKEWNERFPLGDGGTRQLRFVNMYTYLQLYAESTGIEPDPGISRTHCLAGNRYHRQALLSMRSCLTGTTP